MGSEVLKINYIQRQGYHIQSRPSNRTQNYGKIPNM